MFGLQVDAPLHRVVELVAAGHGVLEDLDGVGVAHARKVAAFHVAQAREQPLVHELVEHLELVGAALHHVADHRTQHLLGEVHLVGQVGEGDLGLHHPELGRVARGVGVLGAKRGAKGVDVAKRHGEVLGVELARHGERGRLAKEVLGVVDRAVVVERHVREVERRHAEHLARALAVAGRDDGCAGVEEPAPLEEAVDGRRGFAAHAEHGAEQVCARAQVLLRAEELHRGALLLEGIVGRARALHADGLGRELEGLLGVGCELERAGGDERGGDVLVGDFVIVGKGLAVHDDLQVAEATAVVERDEAEVLHVADGAHPAGDGDARAPECLGIGVELGNLGAFHMVSSSLAVVSQVVMIFDGGGTGGRGEAGREKSGTCPSLSRRPASAPGEKDERDPKRLTCRQARVRPR